MLKVERLAILKQRYARQALGEMLGVLGVDGDDSAGAQARHKRWMSDQVQ